MKHSLQLKLSQHLALAPQLQQSIRLLQLSTMELNEELERLLQENPMLEREDGEEPTAEKEFNESSLFSADSLPSSNKSEDATPLESPNEDPWDGEGFSFSQQDDGDDTDYPQLAANAPSLRDYLNQQLSLTRHSDRDKKIISVLIDLLDEDGYLTQSLEELAGTLPPELEIEFVELQIALRNLQNFDPPGIGARNLSECLSLQLQALPQDTAYVQEALITVREHLSSLAARDFTKLKRLLRCDDATLRAIQSLIVGLNPRPGANFGSTETRYVVPDVLVKKVKGLWVATLNPQAMPRLRINRMYAEILHRSRDANSRQLTTQLQEAKWLIKNVRQRFDTILRVSQAIVDRQRHFFEHGDVAMRPLVLREIADTLELHESTVSRVTTQKFMLTARGMYELKHFFGSHVTTETGGSCSATAIRALMKQLISEEDQKKPLTDSQLSEILGQQGIVVARRTVAKYRESLQILPVNLRKSI